MIFVTLGGWSEWLAEPLHHQVKRSVRVLLDHKESIGDTLFCVEVNMGGARHTF